jgi:hypothetical protein
LMPLARNYLTSDLFKRIEQAHATVSLGSAGLSAQPASAVLSEPPALAGGLDQFTLAPASGLILPPAHAGGSDRPYAGGSDKPHGEAGLWSELSFRLRRPLGILSGAIDKLLITPSADGKTFEIEIVDFKTNRLRGSRAQEAQAARAQSDSTSSLGPRASRPPAFASETQLSVGKEKRAGRPRSQSQQGVEQFAFAFDVPDRKPETVVVPESSMEDQVRLAAADYQQQMQAYALAVRELLPELAEDAAIISTLHFLEPNVEFHFTADLLARDVCSRAIDEAMLAIVSSREPAEFPVHTATHCRMCNFSSICGPGREWLHRHR